MPTYSDDLIKRARELQRLVTQRRKLKRQLRRVDADIKHARKLLAAVKAAADGARPDLAPSRLHAGVTPIGALHSELPPAKASDR